MYAAIYVDMLLSIQIYCMDILDSGQYVITYQGSPLHGVTYPTKSGQLAISGGRCRVLSYVKGASADRVN